MKHIPKSTLDFLKELKKNNDREWFTNNKPRYVKAYADFVNFIDSLLEGLAEFDGSIMHHSAKDCVFRIYRDVRFSKDKSPYKTHFGAHITPAAKRSEIHSRAGYYIHIEPGASMLAGGAYLPQGKWLAGIRRQIEDDADAFRKIINKSKFKKVFGDLEGEQLKRAPKGYPIDHPEIELLKYKSFLASHKCKDSEVKDKDFLNHCLDVFKTLKPFDDFLNSAKA